jgi:hypothetical protein
MDWHDVVSVATTSQGGVSDPGTGAGICLVILVILGAVYGVRGVISWVRNR